MKPQFPAWQPIETAPKDGFDILGCRANEDPYIICWSAELRRGGQWLIAGTGIGYGSPTYWMPRPTSPKTKECLWCSADFVFKRNTKKYCSNVCRKAAWRDEDNLKKYFAEMAAE